MSAGVSLMTKIEAVRNGQQTKEQVSAPEKHQGREKGRAEAAGAGCTSSCSSARDRKKETAGESDMSDDVTGPAARREIVESTIR
jgi:hypothetical protein